MKQKFELFSINERIMLIMKEKNLNKKFSFKGSWTISASSEEDRKQDKSPVIQTIV